MSNTVDILIRTQAQLGGLQALVSTWLPRLITLGTAYKAIGLVKDQIDFADAMGKSAQKAGVLVEQFSALVHVAEQSDVGVEALTQSFRFLGEWMEKTGRATEDNVTVLLETAELFERMPDGVQKTKLAVEMFGRSGLDMIPMLNQGRDGITELMAEAKELGVVIDNQAAKAAEEFNDQLTKLRAGGRGLIQDVVGPLLPMLIDMAEGFRENLKTVRELAAALPGGGLGGWMGKADFIRRVGVETLSDAFLGMMGGLSIEEQEKFWDMAERVQRVRDEMADDTQAPGRKQPVADPFAPADPATNRALHLRAIRSAQVGAEGGDLEAQVRNEIAALNRIKEELGTQFTEMFVPDTNDTEYTAAFAKVAEDYYKLADEIVQAEQWLADRKREIRERDLENTVDGLGHLKTVAAAFGKEGFVAYKGIAIAEAIVATYLAATKALADGDSYSAVFRAAAITAAGIANVATIAGTSYGGAREYGGAVEPGKMYLTGERGREFFVPSERGTIIPAGMTERMLAGNLAPNFSPNINVAGGQSKVLVVNGRQEALQAMREDPNFAAAVIDVFKNNRLDFGSPT